MKIKTEIDYKGLNKIMEATKRLVKREVSAGFGGEMHSGAKVPVATLALWMEKGTRSKSGGYHIPPRPFIEQGGNIWAANMGAEAAKVVINTLMNREAKADKSLQKLGDMGEEAIQTSMDLQNFTSLAPKTVQLKIAKGARHTTEMLLESGELYQSVTTKIK